MRLAEVKAKLSDILHHEEDQVLFVTLGNESSDTSLVIEAMGLPYAGRTRITII